MERIDYSAFLDSISLSFAEQTRRRLGPEFEVISEGLKVLSSIFHGLVGFCDAETTWDDMAKSAVTTLALRILKSLQAAFLLQERDFTMESLCLSRSALESVYTWKYLASNPTRAQAWFGTTYHDAREFRFSEVVRATNSGEKPRRLYRLLCKFAHASGMTFWGGLEIRPTDYNMAQRMLCCEAILRITEQYIGEFMAIFGGKVFKDDAICRDVAAKCTQTAASLKTNYLREFLGAIDKVAKQLHQRIKPGRS